MKIRVSVADSSIGVIKFKTSSSQVRSMSMDAFRKSLYSMVDRAIEEIEKSLRDPNATYIEKTVNIGKKAIND